MHGDGGRRAVIRRSDARAAGPGISGPDGPARVLKRLGKHTDCSHVAFDHFSFLFEVMLVQSGNTLIWVNNDAQKHSLSIARTCHYKNCTEFSCKIEILSGNTVKTVARNAITCAKSPTRSALKALWPRNMAGARIPGASRHTSRIGAATCITLRGAGGALRRALGESVHAAGGSEWEGG